jgi:hypothetical protein
MSLKSKLFKGDPALEACLVSHPAHVVPGAVGGHVSKIHQALLLTDGAEIASTELAAKRYGQTTASAVLAFKTKRGIVNKAYQTKPDNIVGKMTIAALDNELYEKEKEITPPPTPIHLANWGMSTARRTTTGPG